MMMRSRRILAGAARTTWNRRLYTKVNEFTPLVRGAIEDATQVAIHHRQKFVESESLIISILNQKKGITGKILDEVDVEAEVLEGELLAFIESQPKTLGSSFCDIWATTASTLKAAGFTNISEWMFVIEKYPLRYSPFMKVTTPKSHLEPLLMEANKHKIRSYDILIAEEHVLMAYTSDPRLGKKFFTKLGISHHDIGHAAKVVKAFKH